MRRFIFLVLLIISFSGCASFNHHDVIVTLPNPVLSDLSAEKEVQSTSEVITEETLATNVEVSKIPVKTGYRPYTESDLQCMARNMYFEAGGEGELGMRAVGHVVMNRIQKKGVYPDNVCDVIQAKAFVKSKQKWYCQFSWYCDGKSDVPSNAALYARARTIAISVLEGSSKNPVGKSTSFHNPTVRPSFSRTMKFVVRIGNHFFYA